MSDEMIPIAIERLIPETTRLKNEGYRFVTLTCSVLPEETFQIIYTFDRDYEMVHLSLNIPRGREVPSLSPVYFGPPFWWKTRSRTCSACAFRR